MKKRLGSKAATGFLFMDRPFFLVDVELKVGVRVGGCPCAHDPQSRTLLWAGWRPS